MITVLLREVWLFGNFEYVQYCTTCAILHYPPWYTLNCHRILFIFPFYILFVPVSENHGVSITVAPILLGP